VSGGVRWILRFRHFFDIFSTFFRHFSTFFLSATWTWKLLL
jgi:hypothetical protein